MWVFLPPPASPFISNSPTLVSLISSRADSKINLVGTSEILKKSGLGEKVYRGRDWEKVREKETSRKRERERDWSGREGQRKRNIDRK